MPPDVFIQVKTIHTVLRPSRPAVVRGQERHAFWQLAVNLPFLLDLTLLLTTVTTYILVNIQAPDSTVVPLAAVVLVIFLGRLIMYRVEYLRLNTAADPEAHAAMVERSAQEAHVAEHLQAFDLKALEYVLSEYDSQLEAVDRTANTLLGPTRVGGIVGIVALLLGTYAGVQKVTGAWTFPLLALPFGLALGSFLGMGSFDGRRRARAVLARAVALKRP